jgi:stage V sporulation protein B
LTEKAQKSTISKGTYQLFVGNLISTILLAVTSIIVGRLLGPDTFGLYTIALIVPGYVYLVLRWGLTSTVTRYATKYSSEGNERKATSFSYTISVLHMVAGLVAVGLLIPFSNAISTDILHRPDLSTGFIIPLMLLSVVGQIMFSNGTAAFVGLHEFGKAAIFQIILGFVKLVTSVLLILIGFSVLGAVAGYTFAFIVAGGISLGLLVRRNKSLVPDNIKEAINTSVKYAPPIYFSQFLFTIIPPFQSTILAYTVSNTEIGWYGAALNIVTLITLFTYPVSTALLPLFSKNVRGGNQELADLYRQSVRYSALFITPVAMLVMALSTPLATAIFGNVYEPSGNYLILLAIVSLLAGLGNISWAPFLYGVAETRKAFLATAAGSAVSIVGSLIFVFYFGVYGIIIGTILGSIVSLALGTRFVSKILEANLRIRLVWRIYLSSAISALAIYPISLFRLNSYFVVVAGGVFFLLILIPILASTKGLTRDDMIELQEQFKEVKLMSHLLNLIAAYHRLFERKKSFVSTGKPSSK